MTGTIQEAIKALEPQLMPFAEKAREVFEKMGWKYVTCGGLLAIPTANEIYRVAVNNLDTARKGAERDGVSSACSGGRIMAALFRASLRLVAVEAHEGGVV